MFINEKREIYDSTHLILSYGVMKTDTETAYAISLKTSLLAIKS